MGPRGATGMTTLGSEGGYDEEDEFELRKHVASTATAGVATPVAYSQMEDFESGGEAVVSTNQGGAQNNILKTSQIEQTYARRQEDDRRRGL